VPRVARRKRGEGAQAVVREVPVGAAEWWDE
jgi:hypothetical protein